MVTANSARFKDRSIMSDSYVEKYMRAKKRHEVTPKCLFGKPCRAETDEFFLQHEASRRKDAGEMLKKYDLCDATERAINEDDLLGKLDASSEQKQLEGNVKFHPKIVTERDPPPGDNLFSPIDKAQPSTAGNNDTKLTDYCPISKRRKSSSNLEDETKNENEDTEERNDGEITDENSLE